MTVETRPLVKSPLPVEPPQEPNLWERLLESRLWALMGKEINQILRNRQLIFLLLFPPTIQLLIFGFALSPDVRNISLGLVDESQTFQSRDLVAQFTRSEIFTIRKQDFSEKVVSAAVRRGDLDAALIIPPTFARDLKRGKLAEVQLFIDAVDANAAGISSAYAQQILNTYNRDVIIGNTLAPITTQTTILYNPGLKSSWFFVPGVVGLVLTLTSSLVSLATLIREKDLGTLEQLLMTPAAAWEILLAKTVPLFFLLLGEAMLALTMGRVIFGVPLRGNFLLFVLLSGVYVTVGMGIGMLLATLSRSQQQAQLTTFFINLPIIQTAGAIAPLESMPPFFQYFSLINPLRHYIVIVRGILLKGVGLEVLWPNVVALLSIAVVLMTISVYRFRSQLS